MTHDRNRFYVSGRGTYKEIVHKVGQHIGMRNITARATLTDFNTKIDEIYDHLYSLGFGNIHITPSVNMLSEQGLRELALSYKDMVKKFKVAVEKDIELSDEQKELMLEKRQPESSEISENMAVLYVKKRGF